jgi:hypothetical protein
MHKSAKLIDACHTQREANSSGNSGTLTGATRAVSLPHVAIVRAPGLLPMLYRPSELAEELGVSAAVVRDWVEKGLSHQRDHRGHMWIDGRQVAEWVKAIRSQRPVKARLAEGQAYCFRCHRPVELRDPVAQQHGKQILLSGTCPRCGGTIHRGSRNG